MRPDRLDATLVDHHRAIRALHRRQAVRDDQHRTVLRSAVDRRLHEGFALGIERAGRFVQKQDRRVLQQRACDRDALALSAGQAHAALAELGVIAVRQAGDELLDRRHPCRRSHFALGRIGHAVADVVAHRCREHDAVLRDHA